MSIKNGLYIILAQTMDFIKSFVYLTIINMSFFLVLWISGYKCADSIGLDWEVPLQGIVWEGSCPWCGTPCTWPWSHWRSGWWRRPGENVPRWGEHTTLHGRGNIWWSVISFSLITVNSSKILNLFVKKIYFFDNFNNILIILIIPN